MAQVSIPDELYRQIAKAMPASSSPEQFVVDAVREKLRMQDEREEFYRLTNRTRQAMAETGASEEEIASDFNAFRRRLNT